jgi:outer membrane protein assembly factor BamE (lipoprotein component of BamABCDE complex)
MLLTVLCSSLLALTPGCNRNTLTGSKLTLSNYDQVTNGMTKAQVERIMGSPTRSETKDMIIFKRTTYRYEDGAKFALFTFKNDELDSKEGNLAAQR